MADDDARGKGSLTPKITRTNSIFPPSQKSGGDHEGQVYTGSMGWVTPGKSPVIPVHDPRSGQLIGYRDFAGQAVNEKGQRLDKLAKDEAEAEAKAKREKNAAKAQSEYRRQAQESRKVGPLTVDGVDIKPFGWTVTGGNVDGDKVTDENGNDISHTMRGQIAAQQAAASALFSGLNLADIPDGKEQFTMSKGTPLDPVTGDPRKPKPDSDMDSLGARAHRASASKQPSTNMMTIEGGVRWLRRLSVKDAGAYNQMVILLRNAGYLTGKDEQLPLNGWNAEVGKAFAYAAHDLAGAAKEGEERDMTTWLTEKGKTFAESMAEEDAYQPVQRTYADPAELASTARSAAEELLGRALTPDEEKRFQARFRGLESTQYDAIDAAGRAKTSATVINPSTGGEADAFLRSPEFDKDRTKQLTGNYMDALMNMLGG